MTQEDRRDRDEQRTSDSAEGFLARVRTRKQPTAVESQVLTERAKEFARKLDALGERMESRVGLENDGATIDLGPHFIRRTGNAIVFHLYRTKRTDWLSQSLQQPEEEIGTGSVELIHNSSSEATQNLSEPPFSALPLVRDFVRVNIHTDTATMESAQAAGDAYFRFGTNYYFDRSGQALKASKVPDELIEGMNRKVLARDRVSRASWIESPMTGYDIALVNEALRDGERLFGSGYFGPIIR